MTQYEQENDLGRGGGEVDDRTMEKAWATAEERRGPRETEDETVDDDGESGAQRSARFSRGPDER